MLPTTPFRPRMGQTSRRGGLVLVGLRAVVFLAIVSGAFGQESVKPADDSGEGPDLPGQIYAIAFGDDPLSGFVAINPNDGTWTKLAQSRDQGGRVSPDGRSFLHREIEGDRSTRVLDVTGEKEPSVILEHPGGLSGWSGDSRHVFVVTFPAMDRFPEKFETWKVSADGSEREPLTIPETEMVVDVSRDGEWLLTFSSRRAPDGQAAPNLTARPLYVMHPDGTGERLICPAAAEQGEEEWVIGIYPRLSPDGQSVLFNEGLIAAGKPVPLRNRLVAMNTDSADRRVLLEGSPEGPRRPGRACWSPDGKSIALMVFEGRLMTDGKPTRENVHPRLVIVDTGGKTIRTVTLPDATGGNRSVIDWR